MINYLKVIGKIKPKSSLEITENKFSLGFEKLDRDVFDPEKAYDYVLKLGVKRARLQSGWQRTEKQTGVYDFLWLDRIVDNLIGRGIKPWLCLCYGNELYTPQAAEIFGAVGCPPINTQKERDAWVNYVKATVRHFRGRIDEYEVWNEPDGKWCWKHGPNGKELGEFVIETSKAVHEADVNAKVVGCAVCLCHDRKEYLDALTETGYLNYLDGFTYHCYTVWEKNITDMGRGYRKYLSDNGRNIPLWQGESGAPSRNDGAGAMCDGNWTEEIQTKYMLRHLLCDLTAGVDVTSYFSCMDMIEALHGKKNDVKSYLDFGYFGVIGAEFDENGKATGEYKPKKSYYALQTLCAMLSEKFEMTDNFLRDEARYSKRLYEKEYEFSKCTAFCAKRENGSRIVAYWAPVAYLQETLDSTVSVSYEGTDIPVLVNIANGNIYEIPEEAVETDGTRTVLKNIPVSDSPYALMWGDFCSRE